MWNEIDSIKYRYIEKLNIDIIEYLNGMINWLYMFNK